MLTYEEHDLKLWIVNTEKYCNLIQNFLNDFGSFKTIVYTIYKSLNNNGFLHDEFDINEVDYNTLFEDLKNYFQ